MALRATFTSYCPINIYSLTTFPKYINTIFKWYAFLKPQIGRGVEYSNDVICRVVSGRKRDMAGFPEWAKQWFQQTLLRIETFNKFMKNFANINEEQQ